MSEAVLEHVNITVSDPARTAALMEKLFGWKVRLLTEVLPVSMSCGTDTPTADARR